jgi:sugar phosphate isomerase/epimerase
MEGLNDTPREQRQEIFARGVHRVLDGTRGSRVGLAIENHGTQGNDPDFLEGLFKAVGSKRLGLTMDVGNFYWAGYPIDEVYDILRRLAPHAMHTHIKNIRYPEDIRNTRRQPGFEYGRYVCPIPEGDLDIRKIAGFLRDAGYHNDLCIEDESLGKFDQATRRTHIREAVTFLQGMV